MRSIIRGRKLGWKKHELKNHKETIEKLKNMASYYDVEANKKFIKHILSLVDRIERDCKSFTEKQLSTIRMADKHKSKH